MSRITIYNQNGDRREISSIDYTPAVQAQGWSDRPFDPYRDGVAFIEIDTQFEGHVRADHATHEEIEEFNTVHPALALLNAADKPSQLTVLPTVGKSRAEDILTMRVVPWESLEAAQEDLVEIPLDWDAIAQWEG